MNKNGIVSLVIWVGTIVLILGCAYWQKRRFHKYIINNNWFWLVFGTGVFVYFVFFRFLPTYRLGIIRYQTIFGTDLCAFLAFVSPAICIVPWIRKHVGIYLATWMIIAANITSVELFSNAGTQPVWEWIFKGGSFAGGTRFAYLHFLIHYTTLIFGLLLLFVIDFNRIKLGRYALVNVLFILIYFCYILVIKTIYNLPNNITGMGAFDWDFGQYHIMEELFKMRFPNIMLLSYGLAQLANLVIISTTFYLGNRTRMLNRVFKNF